MIVYEYFLDENNFIKGWTQWNPEREKENTEYQEKMNLIKNNSEPLPEMNLLSHKNGRLYNKEKKCNYQLIDNKIIVVDYEKTEQELFDEKYPDKEKLRILERGIIDRNDPEFVEYLSEKVVETRVRKK